MEPTTFQIITMGIAGFAAILSMISIIKSSNARREIKEALKSINFTEKQTESIKTKQYFEDKMIAIRNRLPYDVNQPNWMPSGQYKKVVKDYWYFVKEEYEICIKGNKILKDMWDESYSERVKHGIAMPGFCAELEQLVQDQNTHLTTEPFFSEIKKLYKEVKNKDLG